MAANIRYLKGDIFTAKAQVIVNTVNCKGVMGKGLALAFKQRYPDMFAAYEQDCKTGKLNIGKPTLYQKTTPWILNFPTKNHWRFPSKLEYLEKGLVFLVNHYKKAGITSIAFPKLGAQNGQLSWDDVGPLMAKYLSQLDVDVYIYIAEGDREYQYNLEDDIKLRKRIWQEFSELALSAERLQLEVGLSVKEAKKVADKRHTTDFQALADIENIEKIAKVSVTKIKDFTQKYKMVELDSMPGKDTIFSSITKAPRTSQKSKTKAPQNDPKVVTNTLFDAVAKGV